MKRSNYNFWNTVTILNILLSFMIAVYHNNGYEFYENWGGELSPAVKRIIDLYGNGLMANVPVPLFITLSAFLLYRNLLWINMKDKMKSRITSLVMPYVIWNAIAGLFYFVLQSIPFIRNAMSHRELMEFDPLSIIRGLTIYPYDAVLWTMLQLVVFLLFAPLLYFLLSKNWVGVFLIVTSAIYSVFGPDIFLLWHGKVWLFFYLLGAYCGIHYFSLIKGFTFSARDVALSIAVLIICMIAYEWARVYAASILFIVHIPAIGALWILAASFSTLRLLDYNLYGLSFWIYAIHNLSGPCIEKVFLILGPEGNIGALINTFLISTLNVLLCIGVAIFSRKCLPHMYYVLSGGRGSDVAINNRSL